jgi:hypothetical protein
LAPPAVMVVVIAGAFILVRSKMIDTWYSNLLDHQVKAVHKTDKARSLNIEYGLICRLIAGNERDGTEVFEVNWM